MGRYIACSYDNGAVEVSVDYHDQTLALTRFYVVNNGTAPVFAGVFRPDNGFRAEATFPVGTNEAGNARGKGLVMRIDDGMVGPANFQFYDRYPA